MPIRVAGNQPPPPQMPPQEEQMPPEAMPQDDPTQGEQPVKQLYTSEKQAIMEAMNMIAQALMMLEEVCPPEQYGDMGQEGDNQDMPMDDVQMPEGQGPPEGGA